jgi:hypothetical protein
MTARQDLRHFERPPRRTHRLRSAGLCALMVLTAWVGSTEAGAHVPSGALAVLVMAAALTGAAVARRTPRTPRSLRSPGGTWREPIPMVETGAQRQSDRRWT